MSAAANCAAAFRFYRLRRFKRPRPQASGFVAPSPDPERYLVVMHHAGNTIQLYVGFDPVKARHAYELAPMEAGSTAEFYEWGHRRGAKTAT